MEKYYIMKFNSREHRLKFREFLIENCILNASEFINFDRHASTLINYSTLLHLFNVMQCNDYTDRVTGDLDGETPFLEKLIEDLKSYCKLIFDCKIDIPDPRAGTGLILKSSKTREEFYAPCNRSAYTEF